MKIRQVARMCHEANRMLCESTGDFSQVEWSEAPEWQVDSAIAGVKFALGNLDAPASLQHDSWMEQKLKDGWEYGEVKDADKKTHPCIVPYEYLPKEQQAKDALFKGIVLAVRGLVEDDK